MSHKEKVAQQDLILKGRITDPSCTPLNSLVQALKVVLIFGLCFMFFKWL